MLGALTPFLKGSLLTFCKSLCRSFPFCKGLCRGFAIPFPFARAIAEAFLPLPFPLARALAAALSSFPFPRAFAEALLLLPFPFARVFAGTFPFARAAAGSVVPYPNYVHGPWCFPSVDEGLWSRGGAACLVCCAKDQRHTMRIHRNLIHSFSRLQGQLCSNVLFLAPFPRHPVPRAPPPLARSPWQWLPVGKCRMNH